MTFDVVFVYTLDAGHIAFCHFLEYLHTHMHLPPPTAVNVLFGRISVLSVDLSSRPSMLLQLTSNFFTHGLEFPSKHALVIHTIRFCKGLSGSDYARAMKDDKTTN